MLPPPGRTQTRATAHLRLPVARVLSVVSAMRVFRSADFRATRSDRELVRLLGGVRMLGADVDLELGGELAAQPVARQHADDRLADQLLGILGQDVTCRAGL